MPQVFKDADGDEWELSLTFGTVEQIEATLGVNLGCPEVPTLGGIPLLARLSVDIVLQSRLIWACCKNSPLVRQHAIKEEHFYDDILVDQTFRDAYAAWLAEYRLFFRRRSFGDPMRLKRLETVIDEALTRLNSGSGSGSGAESAASPTRAA